MTRLASLALSNRCTSKRKRAPSRSSELRFHLAAMRYLKAALPRGAVITHFPAGSPDPVHRKRMGLLSTVSGFPDALIAWDGRMFACEFKTKSGRLSEAQLHCHAALKSAGVPVAVVRTLAEVELALRNWGMASRAKIAA